VPHSTLNPTETEVDLRINEMIAALERSGDAGLLVEHLHSARTYILGAMPEEYVTSLESSKHALSCVPDSTLRHALKDAIGNLLTEMSLHQDSLPADPPHHVHARNHEPAPSGASSILWNFFNLSNTSFGTFYPKKFIVAMFPSFGSAKEAESALRNAGFTPGEVLAAPGAELLQFFAELQRRAALWDELIDVLSRNLGTEAAFVEQDAEHARRGAGFLAVYDPLEIESPRICKMVAPWRPISMRRYDIAGIESLI
jgi:hypothetical protein